MTLDQIEEMRKGNAPGPSLQSAAKRVGIGFQQCHECGGRGFTKATLLVSSKGMRALTAACPKELPPIQYERCQRCDGVGGFVSA